MRGNENRAHFSERSSLLNKSEQILPGEWIGVLGGGQLGRMLVHAAQRLGYHVAVYQAEPNSPAAQAADRCFAPTCDESSTESESDASLLEMAELCSVVTFEFENISTDTARKVGRFARTRPSADFLATCQDRVREKTSLAAAGFPVTPFVAVKSIDEVTAAAESQLGWPLVLKTARSGYDGKGQALVRTPEQLATAWDGLGDTHVIAEKWIEFDTEVSMIVARNLRGDIEAYPLVENSHQNHILDVSRCPVSSPVRELEQQAKEICHGIAERFGVVGLFCVEFFVSKSGELMINEIAPRPHNSGHLTIEAFTCSQFEQQVRAICNLPLVPAKMLRPAAMANLLGDVWELGEPDWSKVLAARSAHLHLYGKSEPRVGRKMGHITVLDESSSEAAITARELRESLVATLTR